MRLFPVHTDRIAWPSGGDLYYPDVFNSLLYMVIKPFLSFASAYNVIAVLNLVMGPFGMFLLARYLSGNSFASFLCGVIYGFSPFILSNYHNGVTEGFCIFWLPVIYLFMLKAFDENNLFFALAAGLCAFINGLVCWYYMFFFVFTLPLMGLYYAYLDYKKRGTAWAWVKNARLAALLLVLCLVMIAPLGAAFKTIMSREGNLIRDKNSKEISFILKEGLFNTAVAYDTVLNFTASAQKRSFHVGYMHPAYIGISIVLLLLLSLYHLRGKRLFLLLSGLFFLLCSFGFVLVKGRISIMGPYYLLWRFVPFFNISQFPFRFLLPASMFFCIYLSYGLKRIFEKHSAGQRMAILILALALVLLDYAFLSPLPLPLPAFNLKVPEAIRLVARDKKDGALLDLPLMNFNYFKGRYFYYQLIHGKKILYSINEFGSKYFMSGTVFYQVMADMHRKDLRGQAGLSQLMVFLKNYKYSYIVFHRKLLVDALQLQRIYHFDFNEAGYFLTKNLLFLEAGGYISRIGGDENNILYRIN